MAVVLSSGEEGYAVARNVVEDCKRAEATRNLTGLHEGSSA